MPDNNRGQALTWEVFWRLDWGQRLFVMLMVGLPLTAVAVAGSLVYFVLGSVLNLPWWVALSIAIVAALLIVPGFIGMMGNDAMDAIIGSTILLILIAAIFPTFRSARAANMRRQESILQLQVQPRQPRPAQPVLR